MFDLATVKRPSSRLLFYYFLVSLLSGPFCVLVFPPLFLRFNTLRYAFDQEGISASWGFIFKKEIHLTYRRIQDIHLSMNLVQRWMRLATVKLQTASGSATPELSIEGVIESEALRDALYVRMRGGSDDNDGNQPQTSAQGSGDQVLELLQEIRVLLEGMAAKRSAP